MMKKPASKVIKLPAASKKVGPQKWGHQVWKQGYSSVPSLLFKAQKRLKIKPVELALLMQIIDHWWEPDKRPFPSKERLAARLDLTERHVQRLIAGLEERKFVKRVVRKRADGTQMSNEYDLTGLVDRLKELAPEFQKAEEEAKKIRKKAATPGLRPRAKNSS